MSPTFFFAIRACRAPRRACLPSGAGSYARSIPWTPYLDEGLPVLGLPSRSAGTNCKFDCGGPVSPEEPLQGVQGRVGGIGLIEGVWIVRGVGGRPR